MEGVYDLAKTRFYGCGSLLVRNGMLQGYVAEGEIDFGLKEIGSAFPDKAPIRSFGSPEGEGKLDMFSFIDRTPLMICAKVP